MQSNFKRKDTELISVHEIDCSYKKIMIFEETFIAYVCNIKFT